MINVSPYLSMSLPHPPCWDLARIFLKNEFGINLPAVPCGRDVSEIVGAFVAAKPMHQHRFVQVTRAQTGDLVLLGRGQKLHHCGVVVGTDVLHALGSGTYLDDLAGMRARYRKMEFWRHG